MKTKSAFYLIFLIVLCFPAIEARSQFSRGHNNDDLYLTGIIDGQYQQALFKFTNHGAEMQIMDKIDFANFDSTMVCMLTHVVPDISEGIVFCVDRYNGSPAPFSVSNNYGQTWSNVTFAPDYGFYLASGSHPGEVYLSTYVQSGLLYFSNDYGNSFEFVRQLNYLRDIETGTEPGELYVLRDNYCILHSLNNGFEFDTIQIDTTIANHHGVLKLSRGSKTGELYMYTKSGYVNNRIYKSYDYGNSFSLIYNETIEPGNSFLFTAGRDSCAIYIARIEWDGVRATYTIEHSDNCGQSFIIYNHLVTSANDIKPQYDLSVYPSPADEYVVFRTNKPIKSLITVSDIYGKVVCQLPINGESVTFITSKLNPGIYFYCFEVNGLLKSGKFLIVR